MPLSLSITKTWKFIIVAILFSLYLLISNLYNIPEFRGYWLDKIILILSTGMAYHLGIHVYWVVAFFFVFMSIIILIDSSKVLTEGGAKINILHEYDTNPEKKNAHLKNAVIPLHIYQTWHTKSLPPKMKECVDSVKRDNPEFSHHLFDDRDCRNYIKANFDADVLDAYDKIIPSAYKADLWRYCVLYKEGGIYMDIKFKCSPNFKMIELVDKEHFVLERPYIKNTKISLDDELKQLQSPDYSFFAYNNVDTKLWKNGNIGIYNAFMVCKPKNPYLMECIQRIVKNVQTKNYDHNPLYPTGPGLMGEVFFETGGRDKIRDFDLFYSLNGDAILSPYKKVLYHYPEYRQEQKKWGNSHYYKMWEENKVYQ